MVFRCPECRTRRRDYGLFTQHLSDTGHRACDCGGYHYRHRPGSPYCESNPLGDVRMAERYGASPEQLLDIAADCAFNRPGRRARAGEPAPF